MRDPRTMVSVNEPLVGSKRTIENSRFECLQCHQSVAPLTNGSYRNHCPFCLSSLHVDCVPGDRLETCGGLMEAIGIIKSKGKGYQLIHRCRRCGVLRKNKVAVDTTDPDDPERVFALPMYPPHTL